MAVAKRLSPRQKGGAISPLPYTSPWRDVLIKHRYVFMAWYLSTGTTLPSQDRKEYVAVIWACKMKQEK
jgi:hypothetical protein